MALPKDAFTIPAEATHFGRDAGGHYYVVLPSGSGVVNLAPGRTITDATRNDTAPSTEYDIDGTEKNPQAGEGQGYDSRGQQYDALKRVSGDVSVVAGDKLVRSVGVDVLGEMGQNAKNLRQGFSEKYVILHVLDSATNASGMLPAAVGWAGRTSETPRAFDANALVAQYVTPHIVDMSAATEPLPDLDDLVASVQRGMALSPQAGAFSGDSGQQIIPRNFPGGTSENYGAFCAARWATIISCLFDSRTPNEYRPKLLAALVRTGIDIDDTWKGSNKIFGANGEINVSYQACVLIKRIVFGEELPSFMTTFPGNWTSAFIHNAESVVECSQPHDGGESLAFPGQDKPFATMYRQVITVAPDGLSYTYDPSPAEPLRITVVGNYRIVRKTGGTVTTAIVTDVSPVSEGGAVNRGTITTVTLDAALDPPLLPGHEVAYVPLAQFVPSVGDAEWAVCGANGLFSEQGYRTTRLGRLHSYQSQGEWGIQFWAVDKMSEGLPAAFDAVRALILRADSDPTYPSPQQSNVEFWNTVKGDLAA